MAKATDDNDPWTEKKAITHGEEMNNKLRQITIN